MTRIAITLVESVDENEETKSTHHLACTSSSKVYIGQKVGKEAIDCANIVKLTLSQWPEFLCKLTIKGNKLVAVLEDAARTKLFSGRVLCKKYCSSKKVQDKGISVPDSAKAGVPLEVSNGYLIKYNRATLRFSSIQATEDSLIPAKGTISKLHKRRFRSKSPTAEKRTSARKLSTSGLQAKTKTVARRHDFSMNSKIAILCVIVLLIVWLLVQPSMIIKTQQNQKEREEERSSTWLEPTINPSTKSSTKAPAFYLLQTERSEQDGYLFEHDSVELLSRFASISSVTLESFQSNRKLMPWTIFNMYSPKDVKALYDDFISRRTALALLASSGDTNQCWWIPNHLKQAILDLELINCTPAQQFSMGMSQPAPNYRLSLYGKGEDLNFILLGQVETSERRISLKLPKSDISCLSSVKIQLDALGNLPDSSDDQGLCVENISLYS